MRIKDNLEYIYNSIGKYIRLGGKARTMKKFDITAILPNKFQRLWKAIEADTKEEAIRAFFVLFREFLEDADEYILIIRPYKAVEIYFLPESQISDAPEVNPKFFMKE